MKQTDLNTQLQQILDEFSFHDVGEIVALRSLLISALQVATEQQHKSIAGVLEDAAARAARNHRLPTFTLWF